MNKNTQNPSENLSGKAREYNAHLRQDAPVQPDAPSMTDRKTDVNDENLTQGAAADGEVAPEFGDAADPASEELGRHHRDE